MVAGLVGSGYVYGKNVVAAMEKVERHRVLPKELESVAYIDSPLAIGEGQTISAPHMVGMMASGLELRPGLKVLEIGGGSGYHAAVIAELVRPDGHVYSIERIQSLADRATRNLETAGYADLAVWPTERDIVDVRKYVKLVPPKGAEFGKTEVFYLTVRAESPARSVALNERKNSIFVSCAAKPFALRRDFRFANIGFV